MLDRTQLLCGVVAWSAVKRGLQQGEKSNDKRGGCSWHTVAVAVSNTPPMMVPATMRHECISHHMVDHWGCTVQVIPHRSWAQFHPSVMSVPVGIHTAHENSRNIAATPPPGPPLTSTDVPTLSRCDSFVIIPICSSSQPICMLGFVLFDARGAGHD